MLSAAGKRPRWSRGGVDGESRVWRRYVPWLLWNFGLVNISRPQYIGRESRPWQIRLERLNRSKRAKPELTFVLLKKREWLLTPKQGRNVVVEVERPLGKAGLLGCSGL